jgi:hypothetical protein
LDWHFITKPYIFPVVKGLTGAENRAMAEADS